MQDLSNASEIAAPARESMVAEAWAIAGGVIATVALMAGVVVYMLIRRKRRLAASTPSHEKTSV
jgi:hypothetical protein